MMDVFENLEIGAGPVPVGIDEIHVLAQGLIPPSLLVGEARHSLLEVLNPTLAPRNAFRRRHGGDLLEQFPVR